uniref:Transmembrane protein n=1 Tax=Pithovirus LCDPAC01 TaxID=2506600 RepID=A0A481YMV6_9VIRU|nr:MAG: hypothetical protein LCDPAC01_01160 [Pithovirus LCDPAC01]
MDTEIEIKLEFKHGPLDFFFTDRKEVTVLWKDIKGRVKYFLATSIQGQIFHVEGDTGHENGFSFRQGITKDTIYIVLPLNGSLFTNDNTLKNYLKMGANGNSFVRALPRNLFRGGRCNSVVFSPINDKTVSLKPRHVLYGNICAGDCDGKKCFETDGCGNRCGCPNGGNCSLKTGACVFPDVKINCVECGSHGGICQGSCFKGYECIQVSGHSQKPRYICRKKKRKSRMILYVILALIFAILVAIIARYLIQLPKGKQN